MNEDFVLQFLKDRQRIITRNRYRMSITEEEEKGEEKNEEVVIGHVTLFCRKKFIHKATLITKPTCNNASRLVFWKFEKEKKENENMKLGIVGLPNVGKSTLFNCISSGKAQAANFPFCSIEPNIGSTTVPDDRLNELEKLVNPKRVVPATVEIVDIAGLVKGASKGEGLGNQFLANIRETDAILHILRCFDDSNVVHVDGSVDPIRDKEIIDMELQFKDLETIENRLQKLSKQAKSGGDKVAQRSCDILNRFKEALMAGKSARSVMFDNAEDEKIAREFCLLTYKPVMYVCNVDEGSAATGNEYVERVREVAKQEGAEVLVIAAKIESEIAEFETYEERQMFLSEIGLVLSNRHTHFSNLKLTSLQAYKRFALGHSTTAGKLHNAPA